MSLAFRRGILSRRQYLAMTVSLNRIIAAGDCVDAIAATKVQSQTRLIYEIPNSYLLAISRINDQFIVCSLEPVGGAWHVFVNQRRKDKVLELRATLKVLEFGVWKEVFSFFVSGTPRQDIADFSLDGRKLFFQSSTQIGFATLWKSTMVDLETRSIDTREHDKRHFRIDCLLADGLLAGSEAGALLKVEWPSLNERFRVSIPDSSSIRRFSANRDKFIHVIGQNLICRQVSDFSPLWERVIHTPFESSTNSDGNSPGTRFNGNYVLAADGQIAAFSSTGRSAETNARLFYIEIVDGRKGTVITKWSHIDPGDEMCLSQDGKMLAVGRIIINQEIGEVSLVVFVYETLTGREIKSFPHDKLPIRKIFGASLRDGIKFCNHDRCLITSGNFKTKIWLLG